MSVRITYFTDPLFTQPLPCCDSDDAPPPILFISTDGFNDVGFSGLDDQGRIWVVDNATGPGIQGFWQSDGRMFTWQPPSKPSINVMHVDGASATDVIATVVMVRSVPPNVLGFLGVVVRFQSLQRYYVAQFNDMRTVRLVRVNNGVATVLKTVQLEPGGLGTRLSLRATGSRFEVLVFGEIVISYDDPSGVYSGFVGLHTQVVGPILPGTIPDEPFTIGWFDSWLAEGSA